MDLDRFLAKEVEVEIKGEKVMIKPLTTEFYPLITQLSYYSQKVLTARAKLEKDEEVDLTSIFTSEEILKQAEIESEIAYRTFEKTFEGVTREKFNEMGIGVIAEIMKGAMEANGLTEEKMDKIKEALLKNDKQNKG